MTYQLRYDSDDDVVVLSVDGTVTIDTVREIAPQVAKLCADNDCEYVLNDMSEATINMSLADIVTSPKCMADASITPKIKRALVVPAAFEEAAFLEDVTRNRAHNFRVFEDADVAREWLLE